MIPASRRRTGFVFSLTLLVPLLVGVSSATEIGFVEQFALADDRATALEQLIPGTEDFYFYSCLDAQHRQQFDQVERWLTDWIKRHGETALARQIKARQMLLRYEDQPARTLDYLRRELGLRFDHQRDRSGDDPRLPTALDPKSISREVLLRRALKRRKNTDGLTPHAFDWLIQERLTTVRRRHLLERLKRPDYPGLVPLVIADLRQKDSRGFGSLPIHGLLLWDQLDECLKLRPELLNQQRFVHTYLRKLAPSNDVDWRHDRAAATAYLDRLWKFVSQLDAAHNSLKAQVLYRQLVLDRAAGTYNKSRFMEYLKLPRHAAYVSPQFMKHPASRRYAADLNYSTPEATLLPPIGNDEPLVRSYFEHFFVKDTNFKAYESYVDDRFLKRLFAETKITHGIGEQAQWYAMLEPAEVQAIKDRIDLAFAATNPTLFAVDDEVRLDLHVKNIDKLIVKIFRINTENYYRQQQRPVNTDIQLDGLVPNHELSFEYDVPPERRLRRTFAFPQLKQRGLYVVDFIGNGISSRAVVRKGDLRYLVRTGAAGHVFTILNEDNQPVSEATIWVAGREFAAADNGTVTVPFSTKPGLQNMVIAHDGFAALQRFVHAAEQYSLQAAIHIDREVLLKHEQADIIVRPRLFVGDAPIGLEHLENVRLVILSKDLDGNDTSQVVQDFELHEDRESTHTIQVPARLKELHISLAAEVEQLSTGKRVNVSITKTFAINQIDQSPRTEDVHLLKSGDEYLLEVLGRSGELLAKRPLRCELWHRDFSRPVTTTLQSDEVGQIALGQLPDIVSLAVTGRDGTTKSWTLATDQVAHYQTLHTLARQSLRIPYAFGEPTRADVSLLEMRHGTPVSDAFGKVGWKDGSLELSQLQPGDYRLTLKRENRQIGIRVTEGQQQARHGLGKSRLLEIRNGDPLQIASLSAARGKVNIQLEGATKYTRVHVFATRYEPAFAPFAAFSHVRDVEPASYSVPAAIAQYVAGRDIGDEYRYVLDRKYAAKFPGNMLRRPNLLLNPWAVRDTETGEQLAEAGAEFAPATAPQSADMDREAAEKQGGQSTSDTSNLDFLADASAVLLNLTPDKDGRISVDRDRLTAHQHLHVVAIDPASTVYRQLALSANPLETRDLRLILALAPDKHYARRKRVTVLGGGETFTIDDVTTAEFDYYDSLSRLYRLYATLSGNEQLNKFEFINGWSSLTPTEKRAKYSEFACHELHYFLWRKDREFFDQEVRTYLANKKDPTFLDDWLLEKPLDRYLSPWEYARLNMVERILLGRRVAAERSAMQRHVRELFDLVPRDVSRLNRLFSSAVRGRALESDNQIMAGVRVEQVQERLRRAKRRSGRAGLPALRSEAAGQPRDGAVPARAGALDDLSQTENKVTEESDQLGEGMSFFGLADAEAEMRQQYRGLYVQLERTKEWVENNYYELPLEAQNADLVKVNGFWQDLAEASDDPAAAFFSRHFAEASGSFTEMMLALAAMDLPFEPQKHQTKFEDGRLTLTTASPMVVFHEEIEEVELDGRRSDSILVSQHFYRHDDRYEVRGGVRRDKFVSDEFLVNTVYGCHAVITNPTSAHLKASVLLQIPAGAIPVAGARHTRSVSVDLAPYSSQALEYHFYFPVAGTYQHFPVHVSDDETILGFATPVTRTAVDRLSQLDTDSWAYVSQFGSNEEVLEFLRNHNVHELELSRIAFRMQDSSFFLEVTDLLRARHAYDDVLWSYSLKHRTVDAINEFLTHAEPFLQRLGPSITSPLLTLAPVPRGTYQHREYWPLANARTHQLGRRRSILNHRFHEHYHKFMRNLAYQPELSDDDMLAVTYYMLLQDRIAAARTWFDRVTPRSIQTNIQYDYLAAYLDCYNPDPTRARSIAAKYEDYPVDRWRESFAAIRSLLAELDGQPTAPSDPRDRDQKQAQLAASEPRFELKLDGTELTVNHKNLDSVEVDYYLMDLELLFSRNPFVTEFAGQFSHIFPNQSVTIQLDAAADSTTISLPDELHNQNVLVEVRAAGDAKSVSYYSNSLLVEMSEAYGQLQVTQRETGQNLPAVYVKVYAELKDGTVQFYKDGYTDLRGKFDYTSLSTNALDQVRRLSLLVLSEDYGAVVREARPPKQ